MTLPAHTLTTDRQHLTNAAYALQRMTADLVRLLVLADEVPPGLHRWIQHHLGGSLSALVDAAAAAEETAAEQPDRDEISLFLAGMTDETSTGSLQ